MPYYQPPKGYFRLGLSVSKKFDGGNDDWLMMNGNPNEWAVGYHGISKLFRYGLRGNKG